MHGRWTMLENDCAKNTKIKTAVANGPCRAQLLQKNETTSHQARPPPSAFRTSSDHPPTPASTSTTPSARCLTLPYLGGHPDERRGTSSLRVSFSADPREVAAPPRSQRKLRHDASASPHNQQTHTPRPRRNRSIRSQPGRERE